MDDVAEKIESHAARFCMHAKILAYGQKNQQHNERDAAADREDLENAEPAARQLANGHCHH